MLTGKKAFPGQDVSDVLARILAMSSLSGKLFHVISIHEFRASCGRCLTKDRKNRLHDIGDVRVEIQEILAEPTGSIPTTTASRLRPESSTGKARLGTRRGSRRQALPSGA